MNRCKPLAGVLLATCAAACAAQEGATLLSNQDRLSRSIAQAPPSTPPTLPDASATRGATVQAEGRRVALVIGNAGYDRLVPLKNAANDAQDMCAALRNLGFEAQCHLNLRTRADFRLAVRQFAAQLAPGVSALFYFAGHGVQVKGENFLLPTAIAPTGVLDVEDEGLGLSYLLRSIEDARSAPNVVILDTCRNDPFQATQSIKLSRGLARVEPPLGTVLVYSTAPGREALDGRGRNGLFTKHLLQHIQQPALSLSQLLDTVAKGVEDEARNDYRFEQVPYRSFSYSGAFCFAGCDDQRVRQQVEALQQQSEQARRRIQELVDENARLAAQSQAQTDSVQRLEQSLKQLRAAAGNDAARSQQIGGEITRLQKELEAARAAQASTRVLRQQYDQREIEIRALREQVAELSEQSRKLEAYAARIQALEKENQETPRRLSEQQGKTEETRPPRSRVAPAF